MGNFFQSPFFLSVTIGFPFCLYKILFAILTTRVGNQNTWQFLIIAGHLIIIWACADLVMNLIRAFEDIRGRESRIEFCTLAQAGRMMGAPMVFLALDTLITFSIICFVLWSGWVMHFTGYEAYLWYSATTLNLISLSLVGLWTEIQRLHT